MARACLTTEELERQLRVLERIPVGRRLRISVTFENLQVLQFVRDRVVYLAPDDMEGLFKAVECMGEGPAVTLIIERVAPEIPPPEQNIIILHSSPKATQQP